MSKSKKNKHYSMDRRRLRKREKASLFNLGSRSKMLGRNCRHGYGGGISSADGEKPIDVELIYEL